jgi:hypothetical protein
MDATPESFAYRCLPLNIANAHGWEVLTPCSFEAIWDGGADKDSVRIEFPAETDRTRGPVSLFGQGVITFHVEAIMRTPPGWNLWVSGSPNRPKDGIAPLTGIVETDWSPFTFTMNWRFTRPGHRVRFDAMEPFCFLFPVQRGAIETFEPAFAPLEGDPQTMARFTAWSQARDAFHIQMREDPPRAPSARWQKHYYRGTDLAGAELVHDHQTKLRLKAFDRSATAQAPVAPAHDPPPGPVQHEPIRDDVQKTLAKREWLLEALEHQRQLAPRICGIDRRAGLSRKALLEHYYAPGRPVIMVDELAGGRALEQWSPSYLKSKVGSAPIEYQGGRTANPAFEMEKERHRRETTFDRFIDAIEATPGNDAYVTAYNSPRNRQALAVLAQDMPPPPKYLDPESEAMLWIGPAGTVTSLHHDLTNNLLIQLVGRKRIKLAPAAEVGKLYNHRHVFSEIADLNEAAANLEPFPRLRGAHVYDVELAPGEMLYIPLAWWHQVTSLDFSVSATHTRFVWPNAAFEAYPG